MEPMAHPHGFSTSSSLGSPCNLHLYPYLKETFQGEVGRFLGFLVSASEGPSRG